MAAAFYAAGGDFNINTQAGGGLGFSYGNGSSYTDPDIRLRRDAAGILGIRDDTNAQELRVYSDLGDPAGDYERGSFAMDTNGDLTIGTEAGGVGTTGDLLLQLSGGNVGIGLANPVHTLHVSGSVAGTGVAGRITLNGTGYLLSGDAEANVSLQEATDNGDTTTNNIISEKIVSGVSGLFSSSVGIGTNSPSTELHVEGDIRVGGATSLLDMDAGAKIVGQYYGNGEAELTFLKMYNSSDASINMGTKTRSGLYFLCGWEWRIYRAYEDQQCRLCWHRDHFPFRYSGY